jgi:hypothetical protein
MPDSLAKAKEYTIQIEEHLISSKIEPFQFPRAREEPKMKTSTNSVQDPVTLLAQKFDQMNAQFVQSQNQIMNRLTNLERQHSAPRPQFTRQQKENTGWKLKPQQETKAHDTLTPIGMVNMEGSPWCFPCEEPHWENECPRKREEEDPDFVDRLNFIDTTYTLSLRNTLTSQRNNLKKLGSGKLDKLGWKY